MIKIVEERENLLRLFLINFLFLINLLKIIVEDFDKGKNFDK